LSICQLHISLNRTAQIYLELHFCVELHTKKPCRLGVGMGQQLGGRWDAGMAALLGTRFSTIVLHCEILGQTI